MSITEHALGVTFTVDDEAMARSWHAIVAGGGVWLIDPLDTPETLEHAQSLGEIHGVIQLLDRHQRGNKAIAERLGVPRHRLPDALPGTPFSVVPVLDLPRWRERALWLEDEQALIVAEVVGSGPAYLTGDERVGVHPMLRMKVPGDLSKYGHADHLLFGHGAPISELGIGDELVRALKRSRREIARMPMTLLRASRMPLRRSDPSA